MNREIAANRRNENRHASGSPLADWLNTGTCTLSLSHQNQVTRANLCSKCFANVSTLERPHFDIVIQHTLRIGFDIPFITCDSCSQLLEEVQPHRNCEACREIWINLVEFLFNYGDTPYYDPNPIAIPISHRRTEPRNH